MSSFEIRWLYIVGILATTSPALAQTLAPLTCGEIQVVARAVALPDTPQKPPHKESLDQTWEIPFGTHNQYRYPSGAIVSQGHPHGGGSRSHIFLTTKCDKVKDNTSPLSLTLNISAVSELSSGVGTGAGASSDYDTKWFTTTNLPNSSSGRNWSLTASGIINASNITPRCFIKVNELEAIPISAGPFIQTFKNLTGEVSIRVSCSQGHVPIFPSGPVGQHARLVVDSNVTLSFSRP